MCIEYDNKNRHKRKQFNLSKILSNTNYQYIIYGISYCATGHAIACYVTGHGIACYGMSLDRHPKAQNSSVWLGVVTLPQLCTFTGQNIPFETIF